ncbi:MAG: hypothetical protein UT63_C0003G0033 [Candidatus Gottesmanbacteria bacterium GW2011_GWC2_39_8]|uniref:Glycosyltransferase 2-like domain-containing protein n=1 Tax=Candidatus Gottesmanbacteria bacterium GW2011_GWC2_39_8 TaxID=1618450 RepID=A0A0G0T8X7_9BACT|nr:MAG: hypothetical protein UT63_C0003G0033 [Candidatus Gottesmanbacteria bacterium GW2011_GWC2_39_8]
MKSKKSLSVVIPVYNEGASINKCLKGILNKSPKDIEVIIVYDFNQDSTIPVINKMNNPSLRLVKNNRGKGVLNAIKTGMAFAKGESVLVTMADISDDPSTIVPMLQRFDEGYDIVCGSRYMKGGKKIGGPKLKSFLSWLAGVSGHYILKIPTHDLTNSFKLYRKSFLDEINIESKGGFELGMEIVLKGHFMGKKITEVPTIWYDRTSGKSRFKLFSWLPRYIYWYFWGVKKLYE